MIDICQKFLNKINQEIDSKIFICMGNVVNLNSTLAQQLNNGFNNISGINTFSILAYDNDKDSVRIK